MKEVIKKQFENAGKPRDDEKTRLTQMIGLMRPILTQLFPAYIIECIIEVTRVKVRKSNHFTYFVNATSIESCFSISTFYIGFCHYQLHQYSGYQSCKAGLFKVESEFLLNLNIVLQKNQYCISLFKENKLTLERNLKEGGREVSPNFFENRQKGTLILENIALFMCIQGLNSHLNAVLRIY